MCRKRSYGDRGIHGTIPNIGVKTVQAVQNTNPNEEKLPLDLWTSTTRLMKKGKHTYTNICSLQFLNLS